MNYTFMKYITNFRSSKVHGDVINVSGVHVVECNLKGMFQFAITNPLRM